MQTTAPDTTTQTAMDWLPVFLHAPRAQAAVGLALLALVALALHLVARRGVIRAVHVLVSRTRADWDQVIYEHRVPHRASLVIPLVAAQVMLEWVPGLGADFRGLLARLLSGCMLLVGALTVDAALSALHALYLRLPVAALRPIKSYVQLAKLFVYAVTGIFIVARLADQSPWIFVSGLGAMMAIILLIFRDTLLSLVAGVQLTGNDLIRVGDWIEMPQFGADGDVVDIALNTVTVQNWDHTTTVIPTHKFLDNSFKNWRNMFEGGGRRIKRAVHINTSTIRFLTDEEMERFGRFALLRDYMAEKAAELREHNRLHAGEPGIIANARRLTNVGTLRAYIVAYLRGHPAIRRDLTFLVRQLEPTPEGLPLEIYVFAADTRWGVYEEIQADIFDHILAMVPEFGLSVYQRPSSGDLAALPPASRPFRVFADEAAAVN
ncbi:MAG TPA: mechanosensitive ion channel family protein [Longimicrobium sp.]|nr:mechanosensitive ion channel family protein [Longimicrobium sp.]